MGHSPSFSSASNALDQLEVLFNVSRFLLLLHSAKLRLKECEGIHWVTRPRVCCLFFSAGR